MQHTEHDGFKHVKQLLSASSRLVCEHSKGKALVLDFSRPKKFIRCSLGAVEALEAYLKSKQSGDNSRTIPDLFRVLEENLFFTGQGLNESCSEIEFCVTQRCNLACPFCCMNSKPESSAEPWETRQILRTLDNLFDKTCPRTFTVTGGDPFVRDDIVQILEYIRTRCREPFTVCTNGIRLVSRDLCRIMARLGLNVAISLDGPTAEICDSMRGKGVFERVLAAIRQLQAEGVTRISVACILTKRAYEERAAFQRLTKELRVRGCFLRMSLTGRAWQNRERFSGDAHYDFGDHTCSVGQMLNLGNTAGNPQANFLDVHRVGLACGAGKKRLFIKGNGDIYPCPSLTHDLCCMGNICSPGWKLDAPLEEIRRWRDWSIETSDPRCRNCSVRYFCKNGCFKTNSVEGKDPATAVNSVEDFFVRRPDCDKYRRALTTAVWDGQSASSA